VVVSACFSRLGLYERFERADLDRLQVTANPTRGKLTLVLISDEDYYDDTLFKHQSPLIVPALVRVINAIYHFKPTVVGIDLLTSDWDPPAYSQQWPNGTPFPTIWSVDWTQDSEGGRTPIRLGKVVGQDVARAQVCSAIPEALQDDDGVVRQYTVDQPVAGSDRFPTLVWALGTSLGSGQVPCANGMLARPEGTAERERKIRFSANNDLRRIRRVKDLLTEAEAEHPGPLSPYLTHMLKDAVVILGGAYRHARDTYATPIGPLSGSEILANAVVTQSDPANEIANVRPWASFLLDATVSLALLFVVSRLRLRWPFAVLFSAIVTMASALLLSWGLFNYTGYFIGVFGSLSGVILGVVVDPLAEQWSEWSCEFRVKARETLGSKQG